MKRRIRTLGIATLAGAAVLAGTLAVAGAETAKPTPQTGPGMMGQGYGPGMMMGPGMMGQGANQGTYGPGMMMGRGMGPGMMGPGMMGQGMGPGMMGYGNMPCHIGAAGELDLSADDVRTLLRANLIRQGNQRLEVGKVTKKDDSTFLAEIVTKDKSLVERLEVDRTTGFTKRVN